jgi:hypothetical protein
MSLGSSVVERGVARFIEPIERRLIGTRIGTGNTIRGFIDELLDRLTEAS